jgi:tetratricopeptide (TPR) repeat protein
MQNSSALPRHLRNRLRRTLLALGTTLLCLAAPLASADDLQDAQQLLQSGQRDQALERVDRVLAEKPKDAQARFLKGVILTEQGKQAEAIDVFTGLTRDYPNLPEPYNNLAVIYAGQGQYEKARTALEQSIRTHPSYATAYENLGDVYAKLASQAYGKALQLDATNTGAQNKLSLVRELVGSAEPVQLAKATPDKPAETPKPAAAAPAAAAAAAPTTNESAEVLKAVTGWAEAWSRKDADAYLAFYAPDFAPPGKESRAAWEKSRRERIAAPKSISVAIESPKVTLRGSDQAAVSFRQSYRSDRLKSTNRKTLDLVKTEGGWRILKEQSGK